MKFQNSIDVTQYKSKGFISAYQKLIKETVIPFQYDVMCDNVEGADKSHVIKNFVNAGKALRGENTDDGFFGMVFQDSDAAKWLEAVAYSLAVIPDEKLEKTADELIELIAQAQDEDGYLNSFFTIKDREKRWTNLLEGHELYCSGHMIEAACAYYEATGKRKLLDVMLKNAKHIYNLFVKEKKEGYGGHPEIELALLRLYKLTGEKFCLETAKHFIDVRGVDRDFFKKECEKRKWKVWGMSPGDLHYNQSHAPVREQTDAVGHSVRAVYLYTAMADLAAIVEDEELSEACLRLWKSITEKRLYITGAIGSTVHGEAFTVDYDLPGDTAYAETCASIGLMMFASKMLESKLEGEYADIMEKAFYNCVLAGIALDGKSFFYVNPLECIPGVSAVACTHSHVKTQRPKWYPCACCPPNVARLISSFGKYAYGENSEAVFCHLYAAGEVSFKNGVDFSLESQYPYDMNLKFNIKKGGKKLYIRIPSWSKSFGTEKNGKEVSLKAEKGYVCFDICDGDEIVIRLYDEPYFVYSNNAVSALSNKKALMRGPLVYCFEGNDNENDVLSLRLNDGKKATVSEKNKNLSGAVTLKAQCFRRESFSSLYSLEKPDEKEYVATAIPYYTWCNRGENQMRVWL